MDEQAPSPQTTLAILLGASEWPESLDSFPGSKAFSNTISRFKSYLFDPRGFGLPRENALDLFNDRSEPLTIDRKIRQWLDNKITAMKLAGNGAKDLLLYFVGHGSFVGRNSGYYIAVRCTSTADAHVSGVSMDSLASTLTDNKARYLRRIIILDCCYAAAAFTSFQAEGPARLAIDQTIGAFEKKAKTVGKGTTLLCSSGKTVASQIAQDQSCTMFSKALLQVLSTGDEHRQEQQYFSLREVAHLTEQVIDRELEGKAPRPEIHSPDQNEGDVAKIPFFPNLGARERQVAFPQADLICPKCQHINRFGAKYCIKDGQLLTLGISVQSRPDALIASPRPWQGIKTLRAVAFCTLQGHVSSVHRVAWSPDGKYLASAGSDKKVFVWEVRTGQHISLYREHSDEVLCVAWSPDGRHIASGSKDGTAHVWEAIKAKSAFVYHPPHRSDLPFGIQTVVWSPQLGDKRIASSGGSSADGIQLWRAFTGQVLLAYREHPDVTRSLAWSSNGKGVASGGGRKIHVWDATTGNSMLAYRGHAKAIADLAWSPDNQRIASCGDKAVQIRMARDGKHVFTYKGHSSNVSTVTWSPDGKYLASAGGGTVQIWEADTGTLMKKMDISLRSASEYAAWSPKDPYLALTGERNTIEIWHIS